MLPLDGSPWVGTARRGTRQMFAGRSRLVLLAVVALAAVGVGLMQLSSSHAHSQTASTPTVVQPRLKTLDGGLFSTSYSGGWSVSSKHNASGAALYQLSSTGAKVNGLGIAPAGTVAVTIAQTPLSFFSTGHLMGAGPDTAASRQSAVELLSLVVGTPGGAQRVILAAPPARSSLAGAEAAIESYGYTYRGVGDVQVDLLAHRDDDVFLLELNTEPALAAQGEAALETIATHWRWQ
jgi:hypothetical protein